MRLYKYLIVFLLLSAVPVVCQTEAKPPAATPEAAAQSETSAPVEDQSSPRAEPASAVTNVGNVGSDEMQVPAPVSTGGYSLEFASETPRSNIVSGGLTVMSSYDDNIGAGFTNRRISDNSYSVMPTLSWRQSSSRVLWNLDYAPGFTFYQHHSGLNQYTQNLNLDSQFRLSPHVTLRLRDAFAKTPNPFNQLTPDLSTSTGLTQPIATIVAPVTNLITNSGSAQLTYQFGPNSMIGATGLFSDLYYLNPSQVAGLANSHSRVAEGFYSHRISGRHYIGAKYQYQSLLATLATLNAQTETHAVQLFYTLYLQPTTSLSLFAGPQYSESSGGGLSATRSWSPSYGGSFGWQGQRVSFAVTGGRAISAGGGLQGSVRAENASASVRGQLTKSWSAGASALYSNSALLTPQLSATNEGHTIAGTVSLDRQIGQSVDLKVAYTRLHQSYPNLSILSAVPNTNRAWLSLSYQFTKQIGK
jgi:hypothetical protein